MRNKSMQHLSVFDGPFLFCFYLFPRWSNLTAILGVVKIDQVLSGVTFLLRSVRSSYKNIITILKLYPRNGPTNKYIEKYKTITFTWRSLEPHDFVLCAFLFKFSTSTLPKYGDGISFPANLFNSKHKLDSTICFQIWLRLFPKL